MPSNIKAGRRFPTPSGIMVGLYQMEERRSGELFDVIIPAFSLDSPYQPVAAELN